MSIGNILGYSVVTEIQNGSTFSSGSTYSGYFGGGLGFSDPNFGSNTSPSQISPGPYLSCLYSSDFDLSVGDFYIQADFNVLSFDSSGFGTDPSQGMAIIAKDHYGSTFDWNLWIYGNSRIGLWTGATTEQLIVTVPTMNIGQWYNFKFERISGINTIYLDGISYGSNNMSISNSSGGYITIGCMSWNNPGGFFNGYVDNIIINNQGVNVLNLDFSNLDSSKLFFTDYTSKILTINPIPSPKLVLSFSPERVIQSTATSSGTTFSGYFTGTPGWTVQSGAGSDPNWSGNTSPSQNSEWWYLSSPWTSNFNLSSGDFYIQADFNISSFDFVNSYYSQDGMTIISNGQYFLGIDWSIEINDPNTIQFGDAYLVATVPTLNINQWYTVLVQYTSGILSIYLDGTLYASSSISISNVQNNYFTIGCTNWNNPKKFFIGYLDNIIVNNQGVNVLDLDFGNLDETNVFFTDYDSNILTINPSPFLNKVINYCDIVRDDSLIFLIDTANKNCYDRSGTSSIYNLINNSESGTLINDAYFNLTTGSIDVTAASHSHIDFIGISSYASLYNTQNMTISVWVKWDPSYGYLNFGSYNEGPDGGLSVQYASGAYYYGIFVVDQENISYSSYTPNTYVQITMTYDGTIPAANLYIDGVLLNIDVAGSVLSNLSMDATQYLMFGSLYGYDSYPHTQGSFAHVAIYNRTLSSDEVMQNFIALNGRFI